MSPEDTHKAIRIYIGGLILGVNTLYMLFCFFKLLAVVGSSQMSPEDTHKAIRIYIGGLILGVNTLYMLFCFFKLLAVVGNELMYLDTQHLYCLLFMLTNNIHHSRGTTTDSTDRG